MINNPHILAQAAAMASAAQDTKKNIKIDPILFRVVDVTRTESSQQRKHTHGYDEIKDAKEAHQARERESKEFAVYETVTLQLEENLDPPKIQTKIGANYGNICSEDIKLIIQKTELLGQFKVGTLLVLQTA